MKTALIIASLLFSLPAFADDRSPASDVWGDTTEWPAPETQAPEVPLETAPPQIETAPTDASAPVAMLPTSNDPWAVTKKTRSIYTRAISLQLLTLDTSGMSLQFEAVNPKRPKTSIALSVGGRSGAQGDYASKTAGVGVEIKRWLRRPLPMTGWYVAARTDLSRTTVTDKMEDRDIGHLDTWSVGVSTGFRWVLFHKVELTPSIGLSTVVEGGTMSPTTARKAGVIGLTAGWIF